MAERTLTTWRCDRCGRTEEIASDKQPKNWTRIYFAHPPRGAEHSALGDLCNPCGGRLVDFVNGKDREAAEADRRVADALERLTADRVEGL